MSLAQLQPQLILILILTKIGKTYMKWFQKGSFGVEEKDWPGPDINFDWLKPLRKAQK